jgi:hypothetical protein
MVNGLNLSGKINFDFYQTWQAKISMMSSGEQGSGQYPNKFDHTVSR